MNVNWRGALVYLLILVAAGALILGVFPTNEQLEEISLSQLVEDINDGRIESITVNDNDLQIRNILEKCKDDTQGKRFCIVSSKSGDENILISDYIARSNCITISPRDLLEFSQKGYRWPEEVNQLRGSDFWEHMESSVLAQS